MKNNINNNFENENQKNEKKMAEVEKKSAFPILSVGITWFVCAIFFPITGPTRFFLTALLSYVVYLIVKSKFPPKKIEIMMEPEKEKAPPKVEKTEKTEPAKKENNIRISVPKMNVSKFKNVLLYLLECCAGKPNVGETVLNKLLYFCDFNYYEIYEEHLTGARYQKLPFGPVPQQLDNIINQMVAGKQLQRIKTEYHGFTQTRYLPLMKPDLTQLSAAEKTVIDDVIRQMSDWNANQISEYSHKDKPWRATEDGDYIGYNLVFYRRPPFSVRAYPEDED